MTSYDDILAAMKDKYRELSGFDIYDDSDVGLRMQVLASQLYALGSNFEFAGRQMMPQTAAGDYLDMHAATRGLTRKGAAVSTGRVTFSLPAALWYDVTVPSGTVCATVDDSIRFKTASRAVIPVGALSGNADAVALTGGSMGNVLAHAIRTVLNPSQSGLAVDNAEVFRGGQDAETNDELRARFFTSCASFANGVDPDYYVAEALSYDGIADAFLRPRARGRGTADLYVAAKGGVPPQALMDQISKDLLFKREINVDLSVLPAALTPVDVKILVTPRYGYSVADVTPGIAQAVQGYFLGLKMNQGVQLMDLAYAIHAAPNVTNFRITAPAADFRDPRFQALCVFGNITVSQLT